MEKVAEQDFDGVPMKGSSDQVLVAEASQKIRKNFRLGRRDGDA
jgi:hypothetical protein